jgi:mRNA-degrading endonuclease toxin of MazEF toxin-antitoxin module
MTKQPFTMRWRSTPSEGKGVENKSAYIAEAVRMKKGLEDKAKARKVLAAAYKAAAEGGIDHDSKLKVPQMRAVDKSRLSRRIGSVGEETMTAVEKAIQLHLDME